MKAFLVGDAPVWGDAPTGQRGIVQPGPHSDEWEIWIFTPPEPDSHTVVCREDDFELVGDGLEGIYRWQAVERCSEIQARGGILEVPALLRRKA